MYIFYSEIIKLFKCTRYSLSTRLPLKFFTNLSRAPPPLMFWLESCSSSSKIVLKTLSLQSFSLVRTQNIQSKYFKNVIYIGLYVPHCIEEHEMFRIKMFWSKIPFNCLIKLLYLTHLNTINNKYNFATFEFGFEIFFLHLHWCY